MPASSARILLIDDDEDFAASLSTVLEASGHDVTYRGDSSEGIAAAESTDFDLVITDFRMPGLGGMQVLDKIRAARPRTPVILMTAYSTSERAIEATRAGAFDYLMKPFAPPELLTIIDRIMTTAASEARPVPLHDGNGKEGIIGRSRAMQDIFKELGRLASSSVTVLILGETGTGKELIARALHQHSERASKAFVAVNCGAIPENLIESELFGHEKGAFTHAVARRIGRFEQAQGGTLFLDEAGDLPAATQVKLLRVLQEKKAGRVGGEGEITLDVRIVAATHRDLPAMIRAGEFREDLYYRLNAAVLQVPPLRERIEDIPPLVRYFLGRSAKELGFREPAMEQTAIQLLEQHRWPGNVRELENVVRRLLIDSRGYTVTDALVRRALEFAPVHEPADGTGGDSLAALVERRLSEAKAGLLNGGALEVLIDDLERELYARAVEKSFGNQSQIADWLGVSRVTVRDKLDRFQLLPKRARKG